MKFKVKNGKFGNLLMTARRIGYIYQRKDENRGDISLVRPLEMSGYPRFHLYLKINTKDKELVFNLHLDQSRPIYGEAASAHKGEYEGQVVETEADRIKSALII